MAEELPVPPPSEIKYYGLFTAEGKTQGFWNNDVYPPQQDGSRNEQIPPNAVELTEVQWRELIANQQTARFVDGTITYPLSAQPLGSAEYDWGNPLATVVGKPV